LDDVSYTLEFRVGTVLLGKQREPQFGWLPSLVPLAYFLKAKVLIHTTITTTTTNPVIAEEVLKFICVYYDNNRSEY
jgi:hypothetical protein